MTDTCSHGRPDHQELIRELGEALGLDLPAMAATPQEVWRDLLELVRRRTAVDPEHTVRGEDMWVLVGHLRSVIRDLTGNATQTAIVVVGAQIPSPESVDEPDTFPGDVVFMVEDVDLPPLDNTWQDIYSLNLELIPAHGGPNKPIHVRVTI